jgi:heme A synthase
MNASRILANLVGFMLFVQVVLGGSATLLQVDVIYHIVWGVATFVVLIVATVVGAMELGSKSTLFRVGVAAIVDYVIQIGLGLSAYSSGDEAIVLVHLTNAFALAVLVTYLISFADSADRAVALAPPAAKSVERKPGSSICSRVCGSEA